VPTHSVAIVVPTHSVAIVVPTRSAEESAQT